MPSASLHSAQPTACWALTWTHPEFSLGCHLQTPRLPPKAFSQSTGKMIQKPLWLCSPETEVLRSPRRRDVPFYPGFHGDGGRATIFIFSLIPSGPKRSSLFCRQLGKKFNTLEGINPPAYSPEWGYSTQRAPQKLHIFAPEIEPKREDHAVSCSWAPVPPL